MKQEKEFDRSICFTFYNDFHEQIMDVKRDFGIEEAFKVYEAIANYGLYGTEIEKGRVRTLVSNSTISKIEGSQENRAKWFNGENFEQTRLVAEYMRDHPEASQRTIAAATGVGKTKVGKVQKNIRESEFDNIQDYLEHIVYPNLNIINNSISNNDNYNNIVGKGETDQRDQSELTSVHTESATPPTESSTPTTPQTPTELTWEEYNSVIDMWEDNKTKDKKDRKNPNEIADQLNLDRGLVNQSITEYTKNGYERKEKPQAELDVPLMNGGYLCWSKQQLFDKLTDNGEKTIGDIDWEYIEGHYVSMGVAPFYAKSLIKDFKQRLQGIHDMQVLQRAAN